jgi:excisionase family DNA binding protein
MRQSPSSDEDSHFAVPRQPNTRATALSTRERRAHANDTYCGPFATFMGILHHFSYHQTVNETSAAPIWPDTMLRAYGDMLSVTEVARALNLEERNVRNLLSNGDASIRLPGVKIGNSWRISREQLRSYLLTHHNNDSALNSSNAERGTP